MARQNAPGSRSRNRYQVRLVLTLDEEELLGSVREWLKIIGLHAGAPFRKHGCLIQPVSGMKAIDWFRSQDRSVSKEAPDRRPGVQPQGTRPDVDHTGLAVEFAGDVARWRGRVGQRGPRPREASQARNKAIREAAGRGVPIADIARLLGVSRQRVHQIVRYGF
jgi:hypothetical protein